MSADRCVDVTTFWSSFIYQISSTILFAYLAKNYYLCHSLYNILVQYGNKYQIGSVNGEEAYIAYRVGGEDWNYAGEFINT